MEPGSSAHQISTDEVAETPEQDEPEVLPAPEPGDAEAVGGVEGAAEVETEAEAGAETGAEIDEASSVTTEATEATEATPELAAGAALEPAPEMAPAAAASATPTAAAPSVSETRADIVKRTNKLRSAGGFAALKTDPRLDSVAQTWSAHQANDKAMSHNPNVKYEVPDGWNLLGENVAWGQRSGAEVVADWRDSPGHYANIMAAGFTHIGVGIAYSSKGKAYYTQVFGGYPQGLSKPGAFTDVAPGAKFHKEIEWMLTSGLSTGVKTPAGRAYQPKASVSREAMAAFLYRLKTPKGASKPAGFTVPSSSPFADVPKNHKFFKEIAWMSWSGVSTGIAGPGGKRSYAPKSAVSREAMAAFISRLQGDSSYKAPQDSRFADVGRSHKFYKQISWMYDSKLSTGVKRGSGKPLYQPNANVSREAMAAFIYRLEH